MLQYLCSVCLSYFQELFDLLDEEDFDIPDGMIKAKNLVVELAAGGIAPENTAFVSNRYTHVIH